MKNFSPPFDSSDNVSYGKVAMPFSFNIRSARGSLYRPPEDRAKRRFKSS
jgi:hypothetical protein